MGWRHWQQTRVDEDFMKAPASARPAAALRLEMTGNKAKIKAQLRAS
jgi:hypothetical protein